jgi:hypothetical protein
MKPTVEELIAAQKVLDEARDGVRAIVNEYAVKNRITVYVGVFGSIVRVNLHNGGVTRAWKDGRGVRCLNSIMVDYDEAKIRDKLVEAEKVFEERG